MATEIFLSARPDVSADEALAQVEELAPLRGLLAHYQGQSLQAELEGRVTESLICELVLVRLRETIEAVELLQTYRADIRRGDLVPNLV